MLSRPLIFAALVSILAPAMAPPARAEPARRGANAAAESPAQRLRALGDELVEREFDLFPAWETFVQGAGPRASRAMVDLSPESGARKLALYRDVLKRIEAIPVTGLGESDRITRTLVERRATDELAQLEYPLRAIALATPIRNVAGSLVRLAGSSQPLRTEADFEAWLSRLEASERTLDESIAQLKLAAKDGWTTPRPLVETTLRQVEPIAARPAQDSPLWKALASYPKDAGEEKRADFERRYRTALDERLLPALRRFARFLRDDYLPKARTTAGIGSLPGGDRAYRTLIRFHTTLDLDPGDIHALGLAEVARARARLLEVARGLGFKGEMRDFAAWIASNPANYPFAEPEDVLAYLRRVHARIEPELPRLFSRLPRAAFEIRLTPAAVAASSGATYSRPTEDGLRPGIFHIPVVDAKRAAAFGLTALLLHEGMPGHHLDIGRKIELDLAPIRKVTSITVYSEGWGLYAESLGHELGVYDDPWALLGRYSAQLHRSARLVVDTGLHWKGWSREQAIGYLVEERGHLERSATVAVERYMSDPGQALAYKIGEREIVALREEAKKAMGERFDLREFHEAVLGEGPLTLELLRGRVRAWIAAEAPVSVSPTSGPPARR